MAVQDNTTAKYRYFVVNLVTNQPIAEIPFKGVSYERALKGAGAFSGNISISDETAHLQLYESTMPGRTGLYIVRDGVCVWGGIIWSRSYNVNDRVLSVNASEFTSYFHHRRIWKTFGQVFEATLVVRDGFAYVTLESGVAYEIEPNSTVRYSFLDISNSAYDGYYTVLTPAVGPPVIPAITRTTFTTLSNADKPGSPVIPNGTYINTTVYARTNTYDFVRILITAMEDDFAGIEFPNSEIRPFNFVTANVLVRSVSGGTASLIVDDTVNLVPGQEIQVKNVSPIIDGLRNVESVNGNVVVVSNVSGTLASQNVATDLYRISQFQVDSLAPDESAVTVRTVEPHNLYPTAFVQIEGLDTPDSTSRLLDGEFQIPVNPIDENTFQYRINTSLNKLPLSLSAPIATVSGKPTQFLTRKEVRQETLTQRAAVITTGETANYAPGDSITVSNMKDYATVVKRAVSGNRITYTTKSTHNFLVGRGLTVTGLADTAAVSQRAMTFTGSNATFTVTTSVAHNLTTGNTVTVTGLSDSYRIGRYQYTKSTNTAVFYTGNGATNVSHNIQSNSASGSIEIKNLASISVGVTSLTSTGGNVTLTTNVAHGFLVNSSVVVSGVSSSRSFTITRLERVNNVTTVTTSADHGFSNGDSIDIAGAFNIPTSFNATATISGVTARTFTYSNPSGTGSSTATGTAVLNCLESWTWEFQAQGRGRLQVNTAADYGQLDTMYQGNPSSTFGAEAGAARFQALANQLPAGVTLSNVTSIDSLTLTMTRRPSVGWSNSTLFLGLHSQTSLAVSAPPAPISGSEFPEWTGWGLGPVTRTLTLPTNWRTYFLDGTARGILTGRRASGLFAPAPATAAVPNNYMGVYGEGAGANEPFITVNFTYRTGEPGLFTGTNIGTVTKTLGGYNGTFNISSVTTNTITYSSTSAANTGGARSVSGTAAGSSSPLNKVYTGAEIISKTQNTIVVNATGLDKDVPLTTLSTTTTAEIVEQNGIFNVQNAIATVVSSTQFSYPKTGVTYNVAVASQTVAVGGLATIYSAEFNVTNCNIVAVTSNTVSVATASTRTVVEADAIPNGTASSDSPIAGTYTVATANPTLKTLTYNVTNAVQLTSSTPIYGYASALQEATISYGTYGPYTYSSELGFGFSTDGFSDTNVFPLLFRGFELRNIGEELDKYSDIIDGFEYRVDCYIDADTGIFRRELVLLPILPTAVKNYIASLPGGVLPTGETVPLSYYGADRLVFEFPGNVSDLQLEESAENSATRFFMVGNIGDLGDDISQPYAAATDTSLLNEPDAQKRWPLLDDDEATEDFSDGETLYSYAERYLQESRPPDGKFSLSVNGSVQPVVGTYAPGDWCSLIINDDFINQRLSSNLEPRFDSVGEKVILRKINSFSVEVPDSVTFPEKINLQLIPEWQVDKRGE
jgi:hypothetical protein